MTTRFDQDKRPSAAEPVWVRFFEEATTSPAPAEPPRRRSTARPVQGVSGRIGGAGRVSSAFSSVRSLPPQRMMIATVAALTVAGLAVLAGAALVSAVSAPTPVPAPLSSPSSGSTIAPAAAPASVPVSWCEEASSADGTLTTSGDGDSISGPGVVAAIEHAFYVARSGELARTFAGPGSTLPDTASIQTAIDKVPTGTKHCATIRPLGDNAYSLTLRELHPGGQTFTYTNRVQVAQDGDRFSVISLTEVK